MRSTANKIKYSPPSVWAIRDAATTHQHRGIIRVITANIAPDGGIGGIGSYTHAAKGQLIAAASRPHADCAKPSQNNRDEE
jgi:hypothetical protein